MRQDIELTDFSKGELSPRLKGRIDFKGYFQGCEAVFNMVVLPQGGLTRRPGTVFSNTVKDQSKLARLVPFQFSVTQAYMLEFGNLYIRVYKDRAQVTNELVITGAANNGAGLIRLTVASTTGLYDNNTATVASVGGVPNATGTWLIDVISATTFDLLGSTFGGAYTTGGTASVIVEIPTTYTESELQQLAFTQSNDTLYICHPLHAPATLGRSSHTNWTLTTLAILDGPYVKGNTTATTFTASAASGAITITASSVVGINPTSSSTGQGFLTTDVGRLIRLTDGVAPRAWARITARTSSTQVNATVQAAVNNGAGAVMGTTATVAWWMGKWSDTTGWPWLATFWQQRLFFVGTNNEPNAIEGSQTGDFPNYAPTKADGIVIDTSGLSWIMSDDQVNAARWVSAAGSAQAMQLGIGTDGSEHILQAATTAQALTPTSVQAYRETTLGSVAYCNALRIGKAVLFANFAARKVMEWQFNWQVNGYQGTDKTVNSEHITKAGIVDMVYQKNPNGVVWCILDDGSLIGMTYLPEQEVLAWHRHQLGGDYYGGPPVVEGIACMPGTGGTFDELWLIVKRTINGSVTRYIEVMGKYFDAQIQEQAVFMDSSLSSALVFPVATLTASALTGAGVIFTATAGTPFVLGDVGSIIRNNGGVAIVTGFTDTTHVTGTWYSDPTSLAPSTTGNWSMTMQSPSFTGLTHLPLQTVQILGDGADFGTVAVAADGLVTLPNGKASFVTIGLPQTYQMITMPFEPIRAAAATTQGRTKTIAKLYLRLLESLGCNIGRKITDPMTYAVEHKVEALQTRSAGDDIGQPPPLFTGLYPLPLPGGHDMEGQIEINGSGPYPLTVLAMVATGDVGEMPGR